MAAVSRILFAAVFLLAFSIWVVADNTATPTSTLSAAVATGTISSTIGPLYIAADVGTSFNIPSVDFVAYCLYPISGNYGRLPRILFYATLLFALLARTHLWLIAGALAAALAYSGAAAIHACLLVWRGPGYGESDFWVLLAVLSSSCLLTVPLINWSSTLRTLGAKNDKYDSASRSIIILWGFLVAVGFLCCFVALWSVNVPFSLFSVSNAPSLVCTPPDGKMNYTAGQDLDWGFLVVDEEFVQENNCLDPCGGVEQLDPVAYLPVAATIFRSLHDVQILNVAEIDYINGYHLTKKQQRNGAFFRFYVSYGLCLLPYILLQGMWAACFGRKSPREVRDILYFYFREWEVPYLTTAWAKQRNDKEYARWKRVQRWLAKYFALSIYLWAIFVTILCAPMLIANIIANEIWISNIPQSESAVHIGAWAPYAAVGLALVAAGTARFKTAVGANMRKMIRELKARVLHIVHNIQRRRRARREETASDSEKGSRPGLENRKKSTPPFPQVVRRTGWSAFATIGGPISRMEDRLADSMNILEKEWYSFKTFCKNPDDVGEFKPRWNNKNYKRWKELHPSHKDIAEAARLLTVDSSKNGMHLSSGYNGVYTTSSVALRQPPPTRDQPNPLSTDFTRYEPIPTSTDLPNMTSDDTDITDYNPTRPNLSSKHLSLQKELPLPPSLTPSSHAPTLKRANTALEDEERDSLLTATQDATSAAPGLTHSLRDSITSRKRRSEAYTPSFELSPRSAYPHPKHTSSAPVSRGAHASELSPRTNFDLQAATPLFSEPEMQTLLFDSPPTTWPSPLSDSHSPPPVPYSLSPTTTGPASPSSSSTHPSALQMLSQSQVPSLSQIPSQLRAPSQPGRRSTVSYLQVQRPSTRLFGDEIRLRKDEFGTYHLVEEADEAVDRGASATVRPGWGEQRGQSWFDHEGD